MPSAITWSRNVSFIGYIMGWSRVNLFSSRLMLRQEIIRGGSKRYFQLNTITYDIHIVKYSNDDNFIDIVIPREKFEYLVIWIHTSISIRNSIRKIILNLPTMDICITSYHKIRGFSFVICTPRYMVSSRFKYLELFFAFDDVTNVWYIVTEAWNYGITV